MQQCQLPPLPPNSASNTAPSSSWQEVNKKAIWLAMAVLPFVRVHELTGAERSALREVLARLMNIYPSAECQEFLTDARRVAYTQLPLNLVSWLDRLRQTESEPVVLIYGLPVEEGWIGPTPLHWKQNDPRSTLREELMFILLASILGDPFGWTTLQDGHLIQNVVPIPGQEYEQSGHGSVNALEWHTEDAFHAYRCDHLGLLALRNPERVATFVASVNALELEPKHRRILFEPRFVIRPDNEHLHQVEREGLPSDGSYSPVHDWGDPPPVAVLFGDSRKPYLRIDPIFMAAVHGDGEAQGALDAAIHRFAASLESLVLEPGTSCFLDNYRAIHGRAPFQPRYDGSDRWLKKILVARDSRKSREIRRYADRPVLVPRTLGLQKSQQ